MRVFEAITEKERREIDEALEKGYKCLFGTAYTSAMSPVTQLAHDLTDPIFKARFVGNITKN